MDNHEGSLAGGRSLFSVILLVIGAAVAVAVGLTLVFWVLGLVFNLLGWIARIAIITAVVAVVWRAVNRRLSRR